MDRIIEAAPGKLKGHLVKISEGFDRKGLSPQLGNLTKAFVR